MLMCDRRSGDDVDADHLPETRMSDSPIPQCSVDSDENSECVFNGEDVPGGGVGR